MILFWGLKIPFNCQPLAYATMGNIYRDQHQWKQAEAAYEIALKYHPNDAVANYWYSLLLREVSQLDKSVEFSYRATELDPLHPGHLCWTCRELCVCWK